MQTSKQKKIECFIVELTTLIDIQYRINKETDNCNHSYVIKNLLPKYEESKKLVRQSLEEMFDINSDT